MRSVVVVKHVPWPPDSGDKQRALGLVRGLRRHGDVTVCGFAGPDEDPEPLVAEGISVRAVPRRRSPGLLAAGLLRTQSLTGARFWDPRLAAVVRQETARGADALVVEHAQFHPYAAGSAAMTTVLEMHNVESALTDRYADSRGGPARLVLRAEAAALRRLERRSSWADLVAVASDVDRRRLLAAAPRDGVLTMPNALDPVTPPAPATEPVVCFVGLLSWAPNVDAATWFTRQVWPLVLAARPDARLLLVGRNPAPDVRSLAGPSVTVTGTVPDLRPSYERSMVALAPLRSGGGSRIKILEALAHARPVVATTVGVEGLEDLVGRGVTVADAPASMAEAVTALLADPAAAAEQGGRGALAVREDHCWEAATRELGAALVARTAGVPS